MGEPPGLSLTTKRFFLPAHIDDRRQAKWLQE